MTEPTAPTIPANAPQDVKDFFDCKGDKLEWNKGKVTWLGLPVDPDVEFEHGQQPGSVNIKATVGAPPFGVSFTLPASVNAAGELVVDTSGVPDLSGLGLGGRADVDAAIRRINDWFKHNGKKLKPPKLKGDTVTLEKTPIAVAPAQAVPAVPVVPVTPVTPPPPKPKPVAPPPPASSGSSGSGCSLPFLMLLILFGVIVIGGGVGYVYFGGPGVGVVPTATPVPSATPAPTATTRPSTSAVASLTAPPSLTPAPTVTAAPTASATPNTSDFITALCARVVHRSFGEYFSYIDWLMYWDGYDVDHFVVTLSGASNGSPVNLAFDPQGGFWGARLGLFNPGTKDVVSFTAILTDGTPIDITDAVIEILGESLDVRYPQEDRFGDCQVFGTTTPG